MCTASRWARPCYVGLGKLFDLNAPDPGAIEQPDLSHTAEFARRQGWQGIAVAGLLVLAALYTLYFAKGFLAPLLLAIVFNFFLSPFVRALRRIWIPEFAGAAIVMLISVCIVAFVVYESSGPLSVWVQRAPQVVNKISAQLRKLERPMASVTLATEQVSKMADVPAVDAKKTQQVEVKRPGVFDGFFSKTRDLVVGLVIFAVMLYFLLSSGDLFLRKLIHVLPRLEDKKRAVVIMREIEDHISKYLITVAMVNACLGCAAGLVFWLLGVPNAPVWGILGCLLNFIPYLGAMTEIIIVGLVSTATFPHLGHALLVPACYLGLATIEANFLTPLLMGKRMTLNPVVIFVAVTFWGFLWGILGIFLAVPVLVMLKIFCDHVEPLAPISEFLGN